MTGGDSRALTWSCTNSGTRGRGGHFNVTCISRSQNYYFFLTANKLNYASCSSKCSFSLQPEFSILFIIHYMFLFFFVWLSHLPPKPNPVRTPVCEVSETRQSWSQGCLRGQSSQAAFAHGRGPKPLPGSLVSLTANTTVPGSVS